MGGYLIAIGLFGLVTAMLDMGMNGARYADWSSYGLGMAAVSFGVYWFVN